MDQKAPLAGIRLIGGLFSIFSLFYNFWRCLFFLLVDSKDYCMGLTWATEKCFFFFFFRFTWFFKILLFPMIYLRVLCLLHAFIRVSWNVFFSLVLISNKYQCLTMISLMFFRYLMNLSTGGILGLFALFGFEVSKGSLVCFWCSV